MPTGQQLGAAEGRQQIAVVAPRVTALGLRTYPHHAFGAIEELLSDHVFDEHFDVGDLQLGKRPLKQMDQFPRRQLTSFKS